MILYRGTANLLLALLIWMSTNIIGSIIEGCHLGGSRGQDPPHGLWGSGDNLWITGSDGFLLEYVPPSKMPRILGAP